MNEIYLRKTILTIKLTLDNKKNVDLTTINNYSDWHVKNFLKLNLKNDAVVPVVVCRPTNNSKTFPLVVVKSLNNGFS